MKKNGAILWFFFFKPNYFYSIAVNLNELQKLTLVNQNKLCWIFRNLGNSVMLEKISIGLWDIWWVGNTSNGRPFATLRVSKTSGHSLGNIWDFWGTYGTKFSAHFLQFTICLKLRACNNA